MKNKGIFIAAGISLFLFILIEIFGWVILDALQGVFGLTGRIATISISTLEFILLGFLPLINYILLNQKIQPNLKKIIFQNLTVLLCIVGSMLSGVLTICIFKFCSSPLLPDYLVCQPFHSYWALFILVAIMGCTTLIRNQPEQI
jgi:hypothetical protein